MTSVGKGKHPPISEPINVITLKREKKVDPDKIYKPPEIAHDPESIEHDPEIHKDPERNDSGRSPGAGVKGFLKKMNDSDKKFRYMPYGLPDGLSFCQFLKVRIPVSFYYKFSKIYISK